MKKSSIISVYLTILLVMQLVSPFIGVTPANAATSTIKESMIHTFPQNTWAWNSMATAPNGDIYLTHKVSSTEIAIKKWNGLGWESVTTVTNTLTGDTGFSDSLDLAIDTTGKLHLVFKHYIGDGMTSKRGVKYGVFDGTRWTFSEVEAYSHPYGWKNFYDPTVSLDSGGKVHIVYNYVEAETHTSYIHYATNKSGAWDIQKIATGNGGIDEVKKPSIQVDNQDIIHLSYVKEDNQNDYFGNFYYTKKGLNDNSFPQAEIIVNAIDEQKDYFYSPLTVDNLGNVHFIYTLKNYEGSNISGSELFIHSKQSGQWGREQLFSGPRDIYFPSLYAVGSNLYVVMDSWSLDYSEGHFMAMANYGDEWIVGNKEVKSSLIFGADYADELTYMVDSDGNIMLVMEHGELKKISSLFGTSEDFGLVVDLPSYTVNYDKNGGTGSVPNEVTVQTGSQVTISGNTENLEKPGFIFGGWNTKADGTGTPYEPGSTLTVENGPIVLYAQWLSSNADLSNLTLSAGTLTPSFSTSMISYEMSVPFTINNMDVTPTVADSKAQVKVNGTSVVSGNSTNVNLNPGSNTITVEVISESELKKVYTVTVIRTASAKTPIVTGATTEEDIQSSSGLVISQNATDESIPYFKIDGITGGVLYQMDGSTSIPNGTFITAAQGNAGLKFLPNADENGQFQFNVYAAFDSSGSGLSSAAVAIITVSEVNDAPVAVDDVLSSIGENTVKTIRIPVASLIANDSAGPSNESGQTLTLVSVQNASGGNVQIEGTDVIFSPQSDYSGLASFEYTIQDNGTTNGVSDGKSATASVTFNVEENHAPVVAKQISNQTATVAKDLVIDIGGTFTDVDADELELTVSNTPTNGVTTEIKNGLLTIKSSVTGNVTVSLTANDGRGGAVTEEFEVTITNRNPAALNIEASTIENETISGQVTGTDEDGHEISYEMGVDGPTHGEATVTTDGEWQYTPTPDFFGSDTFDIIVKDPYGGQSSIEVQITVRELEKFTVNFDMDGGSAIESQLVKKGKLASMPETPQREGYLFDHWYGDSAYVTIFDFAKPIHAETTIYAKWNLNEYTISFDEKGGSEVTDQHIKHFAKVVEPVIPTKEGYIFEGWYRGDTAYDFDSEVTGPLTLTAHWKLKEYTISFEEQGGSVIVDQTVKHFAKVVEPPVPTKEGHTFAGWYDGNDLYDFEGQVTGPLTLMAKWTLNEYIVSFDEKGGSEVADQQIKHFAKVVEPVIPTKEGYTFEGWYRGDTAYDFGLEVTGPLTLTAQWKLKEYTISFDEQGGSAIVDQTVKHFAKVIEPPVPTKEGHTFAGWYDGNDVYDFEGQVTGPLTLTAHWTINQYVITFDSNEGTAVNSQTITFNEYGEKPSDPTKVGHTFIGWYSDQALENAWNFEANAVKQNMTLYAGWTINEYTLTFDTKNGSSISPITVNYNTKVIKPANPSRTGYSFRGWYIDEQFKTAFDFSTPITENITVFARWSYNYIPPVTQTEEIVVDVVSDNEILVQTPIIRTTEPNGQVKDEVTFTFDKATELLERLKNKTDKVAKIVIPDLQDKVSETNIHVPQKAVSTIGNSKASIEVYTENVRLLIPGKSVQDFNADLYFRIVPIKGEEQQKQVQDRAKLEELIRKIAASNLSTIEVLGRPMTIETNLQNRPVTLILPIEQALLENEKNREDILKNLVIFIEHSDGSKEVVQGSVVNYKEKSLGVELEVNQFSTFTMLYIKGAADYFEKQADKHESYITGYQDGTFRPNQKVNRAQMATMMARNLGITYSGTSSFTDTKTSTAFKEIEIAREAGIITGYTDGTFKPTQAITRAQMATIASRWITKECKENETSVLCKEITSGKVYTDVANGHWASDAIQHVTKTGIMKGLADGTFRPEESLTRAQAVVVLNRLFGRDYKIAGSVPSFTDVSKEHWAYGEIEEAATNHLSSIHMK